MLQKIEDNRALSDELKKDRIKIILDREERLLALFIMRADRILR